MEAVALHQLLTPSLRVLPLRIQKLIDNFDDPESELDEEILYFLEANPLSAVYDPDDYEIESQRIPFVKEMVAGREQRIVKDWFVSVFLFTHSSV